MKLKALKIINETLMALKSKEILKDNFIPKPIIKIRKREKNLIFQQDTVMVGWLVGFYGVSTFEGYLTPNPFLCK